MKAPCLKVIKAFLLQVEPSGKMMSGGQVSSLDDLRMISFIVACLELGTGVFLLSKVLQKKPIADRKVPYGLLFRWPVLLL